MENCCTISLTDTASLPFLAWICTKMHKVRNNKILTLSVNNVENKSSRAHNIPSLAVICARAVLGAQGSQRWTMSAITGGEKLPLSM